VGKSRNNSDAPGTSAAPLPSGHVREGEGGNCDTLSNLLVNADFEQGNSGFTSEFTFDATCKGTHSPGASGSYAVNGTVHKCHDGYADSLGDQGKMLVVNYPSSGDPRKKFWCQTVQVNAGAPYKIAARLRAAVPDHVDSQPTSVAITANGSNLMAEFNLEREWKEYTHVLMPPVSGTVAFCAEARTQNAESTDLVMDDISFAECKPNR
jgi:hypothetical protein